MTETTEAMQTTSKQELESAAEETRPGPVFTPAVDIFEGPHAITLLVDMPGVQAERLDVDLREGLLTLRGDVAPLTRDGEVEVLREYDTRTFYRQFRLSDAIDQERIDAKLTNGVLRLELPKTQALTPRKIPVTTT